MPTPQACANSSQVTAFPIWPCPGLCLCLLSWRKLAGLSSLPSALQRAKGLSHICSGTALATLHSHGPSWRTNICQIVIVYQELIWSPLFLSECVSFPRSLSPADLLPGAEAHSSALAEHVSSASLFFSFKSRGL